MSMQGSQKRTFVEQTEVTGNEGKKLNARMVKAPEGDFRDWRAIQKWARNSAAALLDAEATPRTL